MDQEPGNHLLLDLPVDRDRKRPLGPSLWPNDSIGMPDPDDEIRPAGRL